MIFLSLSDGVGCGIIVSHLMRRQLLVDKQPAISSLQYCDYRVHCLVPNYSPNMRERGAPQRLPDCRRGGHSEDPLLALRLVQTANPGGPRVKVLFHDFNPVDHRIAPGHNSSGGPAQ